MICRLRCRLRDREQLRAWQGARNRNTSVEGTVLTQHKCTELSKHPGVSSPITMYCSEIVQQAHDPVRVGNQTTFVGKRQTTSSAHIWETCPSHDTKRSMTREQASDKEMAALSARASSGVMTNSHLEQVPACRVQVHSLTPFLSNTLDTLAPLDSHRDEAPH